MPKIGCPSIHTDLMLKILADPMILKRPLLQKAWLWISSSWYTVGVYQFPISAWGVFLHPLPHKNRTTQRDFLQLFAACLHPSSFWTWPRSCRAIYSCSTSVICSEKRKGWKKSQRFTGESRCRVIPSEKISQIPKCKDPQTTIIKKPFLLVRKHIRVWLTHAKP